MSDEKRDDEMNPPGDHPRIPQDPDAASNTSNELDRPVVSEIPTPYPTDFDDPNREFNARLVPFAQNTLAETLDSLQDEAAVREMVLSDGRRVKAGPRLLQDAIVDIESRSGVIAETDDQGNITMQTTFPEKDKRGRVKRGRFYTGISVEAFSMDSAAKSADLRQRGREPRDLEIKNMLMSLAKETGEDAQRKGDEVDRKIISENFEYRPPYIQKPTVRSVRLEKELGINTDPIGRLVARANKYLRDKGGRSIEQVKVQLARFTEHNVLARAGGTLVDQLIPRTSLSMMLKTVKGSEAFGALRGSCGTLEQCMQRYTTEAGQTDLFDIVEKMCQQVLDEATDLDRADGSGILGSRCPVIFAPQVAGVFAHECFGHPAEGDIIVENFKDQSAQIKLKSRLGAQVSDNPRFTVIESPYPVFEVGGQILHRFNWGAYEVDRYGELAKICTIIENGIMVEAMTDMYTHEYVIAGLKADILERMNRRGLSGSSRRENYSVRPQIRMRNTFILPDPDGPSTKEEMAAKYNEFKVKKGIYVKSCKGGWVDTRSGTFNIIGNLSYLIENGMVTSKPIKDVNVTGKLADILPMIGGIGNASSMHHTFTGFCGKNNQWVPVDGGGPIIYLKDAQVGGGSTRPWSKLVEDYDRQLEDVQKGKISRHQVVLPEVDALRNAEGPIPHVCLLTEFLPFQILTKIIMGERTFPTHEVMWSPGEETYRVVERRDRHGL